MGVAKLPGGGNITGAGSDDETPVKGERRPVHAHPSGQQPENR